MFLSAGTTTAARALTDSEIAGFSLRHPLEATRTAATRVAISSGVYDWGWQYLPSWAFDLVPPWGEQVDDSELGTVTIFFGQGDGALHMTAFSPVMADVNKPAYVPPPHLCKDGSSPNILGICPEDYQIPWGTIALVGAAILFGYHALFARK